MYFNRGCAMFREMDSGRILCTALKKIECKGCGFAKLKDKGWQRIDSHRDPRDGFIVKAE